MSAASPELCRELYELSGWDGTDYLWASSVGRHYTDFDFLVHASSLWTEPAKMSGLTWAKQVGARSDTPIDQSFPAYDLGYLLHKLPEFYDEHPRAYLLTIQPNPIGAGWQAHYRFASRTPNSSNTGSRFRQEAETPEDAAAKLAIELFKSGVLKS